MNEMKSSAPLPDIQRAVSLHQSGKLAEAEKVYREILRHDPGHFHANHLLGVVLLQRGNAAEAERQISVAIQIDPSAAAAYKNLGNAQRAMGKPEDALASYNKASELKPDFADVLMSRGIVLSELRRFGEAVVDFDRYIALKPADAEAFWQKGNAQAADSLFEGALESYDKAIALKPGSADIFFSRGKALRSLRRYDEALASLKEAIDLRPDFAPAYVIRGNVLIDMQRIPDALAAFDTAIALNPGLAEAHHNRGNILQIMNRREEALDCYQQVVSLNPDYSFAAGILLSAKLYLCDWRDWEGSAKDLLSKARAGKMASAPFTLIATPYATAEDQLACCKIYTAAKFPAMAAYKPTGRGAQRKIRLAYVSADFHAHATSYLMAGLFEMHDKSRFETMAFSFGRNDCSDMRTRLEASFDSFVDVRSRSDEEIADILREREIDIAVDLKGFTRECRFGIFVRRPAPVQVNYLGYPGTLGAPCMDYIIGDKVVIPSDAVRYYSEKVVYLPDCYQPNDNKRKIATPVQSRTDLGLPDNGFVFCSFNNNYKFTPDVFDVWMRLLKGVPDSVIWLLEPGNTAAANLRSEAQKRGVSPDRVIFTPRLNLDQHLARHRHADLFLDTIPCNAHTTASDALWAGLPLVTCIGQTFASRVAASLLTAAGLPELITSSLQEYEQLALKLARDPRALGALKSKLAGNLDTCALFNTERYTRNLEAAYARMWARHQNGEPPESFSI
ncbi:MAG: tetratricopeptide repeat protein [Alphaproteobacteria bacterium]